MLKTSLEQAKKWSGEMQVKSDQEKDEMKNALEVAQGNLAAMKTEEEAARATKEAKVLAHKEAKAATESEKKVHAEAEAKKNRYAEERQEFEAARAEVASVLDGQLNMLMNGGWEDNELRDDSITAVCAYLKTIGADPALLSALPKALASKPTDRGDFDKIAVDEAFRVLSEKAALVAQQLAESSTQFDEVNGEYLGAWAIWEEAAAWEVNCSGEVAAAEVTVKSAAIETNMAQSKVQDLEKKMGLVNSQRFLLDQKAEQIDLAFGAMETLEKGEEVSQDVDMTITCAAAVSQSPARVVADVEMKEVPMMVSVQ